MGHGMMRGVFGVGCIAVGVAAHQSVAQAVRTETVLPASTDPAISGWFGAHFAAFAPTAATRDRLFVYLHGQGGTAGGATELVKSAAEVGFHAVGLTYPNDWSPFNVCGGDPACPEALRREIVDGVDRTPVISVARADSIENRLIKLLTRLDALHPGEGWLQFINGDTIRWDLITLWGHSQGGGNAGIIAKHQSLGRVCLSAPAADGGPGSPAAWWASHLTPSANYFGFCHTQDALSAKVAFWSALGMSAFGSVLDVAVTPAPYSNTHSLSTSVAPAVAGQFHNSVVADALTPRGAGNVPVYKPVWQYMMTSTTAGSGPGPTWNDVTFATVPTSTGTASLQMDIYAATSGTGPRPLLIWIHGGGWQSGSHNQVPDFALALRARGISVASIGYRLTGQSIFPTQIHDCKGAVRFLRARAADFNLDPTRFGVWGSSAGGHLAALVATSGGVADLEGVTGGNLNASSDVMVCGDYFGPTELLTMALDCDAQSIGCGIDHDAPSSAESLLLGVSGAGQGLGWLRENQNNPAAPFPALIANARASDPITHVDAADPPMYIAHGLVDTVVPIGQSRKLRDALVAAGVAHVHREVAGAGHGALGDATNTAAAAWIGDILLGSVVCPTIVEQPADVTTCPGGEAVLEVLASGLPLNYQWKFNGLPLTDVPGHVQGATTSRLVLSGLALSEAGTYACEVSNSCTSVGSLSAWVTVCAADYDCNGGIDGNDVGEFFRAWEAGTADVNGDGGVDGEDVSWFFELWEAGGC